MVSRPLSLRASITSLKPSICSAAGAAAGADGAAAVEAGGGTVAMGWFLRKGGAEGLVGHGAAGKSGACDQVYNVRKRPLGPTLIGVKFRTPSSRPLPNDPAREPSGLQRDPR